MIFAISLTVLKLIDIDSGMFFQASNRACLDCEVRQVSALLVKVLGVYVL
jgi:hypothetical protein